MAAKTTVLVTAASGNIGKATLSALASYSDSIAVKAGVRDPSKSAGLSALGSNVAVVAADPLKAEEFEAVLQGVDLVYVIAPGSIDREKVSVAAIEGAKKAGVKFILVLSVFTADLPDTVFGSQFGPVEAAAKASGLPFTIIRLPFFTDNNFGFAGTVKEQGAFYSPIEGDKPFTPVATKDVGEASAKILTNFEPHVGKTYKLSSPGHTQDELAKLLSDALGKEVKHVQVPYEAAKEALLGFGFQEWQIKGIAELQQLINASSPITNDPAGAVDATLVLGHPVSTLADWVSENIQAFK